MHRREILKSKYDKFKIHFSISLQIMFWNKIFLFQVTHRCSFGMNTSRFARGVARLAKGGKRNARMQFSQSTARPLPSNVPSKKRMDTIKRSSINHATRDTRYDISAVNQHGEKAGIDFHCSVRAVHRRIFQRK